MGDRAVGTAAVARGEAPIRLLILTPEYVGPGGGIMTFYRALVPALISGGWHVRVIEGSALRAAEQAEPRTMEDARVETLELARLGRWWRQFASLAGTPGLRRHLAAAWAMWEQAEFGEGCDIVEAADWGLLFVPPIFEGKRPVIVQGHGSSGQIAAHDPIAGEETQDSLIQLIERAAMGHAGAIQVTSRANADFWQRETGRKVHMIRPAFAPTGDGAQAVGSSGLVVGRVQRWKGPQVVGAALERLGARAPAIDWYGRDTPWGSSGSSSAAYLASTYRGIWGTKLVHHAPITTDEVARRQASALFNLVPSTWDTFNLTAVEAMASGRPTIVSTGAGASELIGDGINGFLFPAGDADGLAAAIERVMSESPAQLAEIGKAAQETVRTALDPDKIAAERIACYRSEIESFERNRPAPIEGWLGDICRPSPGREPNATAFLDHHPLREILAYSARRLGRRLWPL